MQKIILQPCGNKLALDHFEQTIINGVGINLFSRYLSSDDYSKLKEIYQDKKIEVWGVTPGVGGKNISKYEKTNKNDLVLFVSSGSVIYISSICFKIHNEKLAKELWGLDEKGQTWEYIYFLIDGNNGGISIQDISFMLGYKENFVTQGFMVVDEDKSNRLFEKYPNLEGMLTDLDSDYTKPTEEECQYIKGIAKKIKSTEEVNKIIEDIERSMFRKPPREKQRMINAIVRNPVFSRLTKERAQYRCEICFRDPFETENGYYAEAHHLHELSNGGIDLPSNMICVCPDCHRKIHFAKKEVSISMLSKFIV